MMKFFKGVLITLGVLFVVVVGLIVYTSRESSQFLDENKEFITQFSFDLSERWNVEDVHSRLSNEFLQSLDTPTGQFSFNQLKALGKLKDVSDFSIISHRAATSVGGTLSGTTAVINFKATFENVKGLVTVTLVKREGKVFVQGFHFSASGEIQPGTRQEHSA